MTRAVRAPLVVLCTVALGALVAAGVRAQTPQDPQKPADPAEQQPIFRAKINLVRVDVSVTDRDGEPMNDLQAVGLPGQGRRRPADRRNRAVHPPQRPASIRSAANRSTIRSPAHARVEAARDDVRLFVLFLDDYHVDKHPQIMVPLRRTLKAFVDKLGPYDLVAVVDPLTPLTHSSSRAIATRSDGEGAEVRGPARRALPGEERRRRSAAVRSAMCWELRAGVTLDAVNAIATHLGGLREGRKSDPLRQPGAADQPAQHQLAAYGGGRRVGQPRQRHHSHPRPAPARQQRVRRQHGAAPLLRRDRRSRHLTTPTITPSISTRCSPTPAPTTCVGYAPPREMADGKFHKIDVGREAARPARRRAPRLLRAAAGGPDRPRRHAGRAGSEDGPHRRWSNRRPGARRTSGWATRAATRRKPTSRSPGTPPRRMRSRRRRRGSRSNT